MALTEVSYPVTGSAGSYQNIFPSQKNLYAKFNRKDSVITSIISGTDNKARIAVSVAFDTISVGDFITFETDGYPLTSAKVLTVVDTTTIEVDVTFTNGNVSNNFLNYHQNYFLEVRYVVATSATDDQDAIQVIDDISQIPNAGNGDINARINLPSDLLVPNFSLSTGEASELSTTYKIQFRESYDGNRSGLWVSPSVDIPILLIMGTSDAIDEGFPDSIITKRFIAGYPLLYSIIHSSVNDSGSSSISVNMKSLAIDKSEIATSNIATISNLNGVYLLLVDTTALDSNTAFIEFSSISSSSAGQYDPTQYDPTQYA